MTSCEKCGSDEIATILIHDNSVVSTSSFVEVKSEFLYSIEYEIYYKVKALKEHLLNSCKCGHEWRSNTKENP